MVFWRPDEFMGTGQSIIHSDPEILGGTPVFIGTRVPAQALIDYLEAGHPLDEFLVDFPSVTREQAVAALDKLSMTGKSPTVSAVLRSS
jgi:uncharacterized protein (DUF433 family)